MSMNIIVLLAINGIIVLCSILFAIIFARDRVKLAAVFAIYVVVVVALAVIMLHKMRDVAAITESFESANNVSIEALPVELTDKLKFYVSSLGVNSYEPGRLVWKDISTQSDTNSDCGQQLSRDFAFSDEPAYDDVKNGLDIKGVVLTGPKSENLGIIGNSDFTLYWNSANQSIVPQGETYAVFEMYANTQSNVALRVGLRQSGTTCSVVVENSLDNGATLNSQSIDLSGSFENKNAPCSFAVVRAGATLQVYFNDAPQGAPIPCGEEKILLSNKRCSINPAGQWDAKLLVFALYRKALTQPDIAKITAYIQKRLVVLDDQYQAILNENQQMQQQKQCPLSDPSICAVQCAAVADWSNPTNFLQNASVECKAAIDTYCKANPQDNFCGCWQTANATSTTCQVLRSFFDASLTPASQQCDVRKLYPNSDEPSLDKYYTVLNPINMSAMPLVSEIIKMPNDIVVNWQERSGQASMLSPNTFPSDRVLNTFTGLGSSASNSVSISQSTVDATLNSSRDVTAMASQIMTDLQSMFSNAATTSVFS